MPVSALEWGADERHAVNQSWCTGWGASSTYSRNARVTAKVGYHMGAILGCQQESDCLPQNAQVSGSKALPDCPQGVKGLPLCRYRPARWTVHN
jgi:hypothetical protein